MNMRGNRSFSIQTCICKIVHQQLPLQFLGAAGEWLLGTAGEWLLSKMWFTLASLKNTFVGPEILFQNPKR